METTLYKLDKNNNVLVWTIHSNDKSWWTTSGRKGGKLTSTLPTYVEQKNVGKANETSLQQQVDKEVASKIQYQLDHGYSREELDGNCPKRFDVTLAKEYKSRKKVNKLKFPYLCQPKLDGIRCYIKNTEDGVKMFTRNHKLITSCPHIIKMAEWIIDKVPDIVLDGELYNHDLKDNFNKICSYIRKVKLNKEEQKEIEDNIQFHCFDVYIQSEPHLNYYKRNDRLYKVLINNLWHRTGGEEEKKRISKYEEILKPLRIVGYELLSAEWVMTALYQLPDTSTLCILDGIIVNEELQVDELLREYLTKGFEGVILRDASAPYTFSRTDALLKYKLFKDAEYEIIDFEVGDGNSAELAATVVCKDKTGQTFKAGCCGTNEHRKHLIENKQKYIGKKAIIKYQELTPIQDGKGGVPRFGKMVEIRDYE